MTAREFLCAAIPMTCALLAAGAPTRAAAPRKVVPHNQPVLVRPEADGSLRLTAGRAEIYGTGRIAVYDGQMCIGWWTDPGDHVAWEIEVPAAGVYDAYLHWAIPPEMAGNWFTLSAGHTRIVHRVPATGSFDQYRLAKFGQLRLAAGRNRVEMRPVGPLQGELADLKEVRLRPADPAVPALDLRGEPETGLPAEAAAAAARVPEGFTWTLVAAEPDVVCPTSIVVDTHGRVWVTEASLYRQNPTPIDRVKVFEDTDGDGRADRVTVFYEGLMAPMSLAVAGPRVYVAESPKLLVFEDRDSDLRADGPPRVLLEGFGGFNDDQALHGLVFGPDHRLYMTQGDHGLDVTGPDGVRVRHDVGAILRCEPDGRDLKVLAWDLKNPIEVALNSWGEGWFNGNDDDGTRMCRLDYLLDGGSYGWRYWGVYGQRRQVYGSGPEAHWHANVLGVVPPALITGFGAPCGVLFIETDAFGPAWRGRLLAVDAGPRTLTAYRLRPDGAGFQPEPERLVANERDAYFRPIDAAFAPDGSLYVCDWSDLGVGGHAYNNPNRGRIYRLRGPQPAPQPAGPAGPVASVEQALEALGSPNLDRQFLARERLLAAGPRVVPELERALAGSDATLAARALWLLARLGPEGRAAVRRQLHHPDATRRALAVRVLRRVPDVAPADLAPLLRDPSPAVRCEGLLALRDLDGPEADRLLLELARQWDGQDRFYLEALGIAARGRAGQAMDRFPVQRGGYETMRLRRTRRAEELWARLIESPEGRLDPKAVAFTYLLRPREATAWLLARLPGESPAVQMAILGRLGPETDAAAGRAVLGLLVRAETPAAVRETALEALRRNLAGPWRALAEDALLRAGLDRALAETALVSAALGVIREARLDWARPALLQLARAGEVSESRRAEALDLWTDLQTGGAGSAGAKEAVAAVREILSAAAEAPALQRAALRAVARLGVGEDWQAMLANAGLSVGLREQLIRELGQRSAGALWLYRQLEARTLAPALSRAVAAVGLNHPDLQVRALFQAHVPEAERPRRLGETVRPEEVLALKGDPERGRSIFFEGSVACSTCHRVGAEGMDFGPDLSVIGRKYGREALLQAILEPSAAVSPDYQASLVETREGDIYVGFVRPGPREGQLSIKTRDQPALVLDRAAVTDLQPQRLSLMPEQLAGMMTAQDLADLVAFLSGLKSDTQLVPFWWVLGVFSNADEKGFDTDFGPEAHPDRIEHELRHRALDGREVGWTRVEARPFQGSLGMDLQQFVAEHRFPTADLIAYYAVAVHSPQAQAARLLVGSEDGVKVWLNGELVHRHLVRRSPPHLGQDQIVVNLRPGKNLLLVKLEQVSGGGGLLVAVQADENVTFGMP